MTIKSIITLKKLINKEIKQSKTDEYKRKLYIIFYELNDLQAKLIVEETNYDN